MTPDPRCGSTAGYQAHTDNGTPKCRPCMDAQADWQRHYRTRMYLAGGPMLIDATGTRRRLRALVRMGWPFDRLAVELGLSAPAVRSWTYNQKVHRDTAARVAKLYDALWDQPGPSKKSAARAQTAGWMPPLAWNDDSIDDPRARPTRMITSRVGRAFDDIAVERAMHGDRVHLRPAERKEAVRRLSALGLSAAEIAERLDVSDRAVTRHRSSAA